MTIRDLTGCEFGAKPSNHPSGLVWLDVTVEEETDQHAMTADAAEALAAELLAAARRARIHDEQAPVHALWPRDGSTAACGATWPYRRQPDSSSGYAHATCATCIRRLIDDGVTLANPLGMADHLLRRMALADKPDLPE